MADRSLKDIYEQLEGNYESVLRLLKREAIIFSFLEDFLEDEEFFKLERAMETGDDSAAFEAAHALKGVTLNMGFGFLSRSVAALTESLRHGRQPNTDELYRTVRNDYWRTVQIIKGENTEA